MFESLRTVHKNAYSKKHIENDEQLIRWIPYRYKDYTHTTLLDRHVFADGLAHDIAVLGRIESIDRKTSNGKNMTVVKAMDENGTLFTVTFLHRDNVGAWLAAISGNPVLFMGQFKWHPYFGFTVFNAEFTGKVEKALKVVPVYHHIKGVAENTLVSHIDSALTVQSRDTVPKNFLGDYPELATAFQWVHHPITLNEAYWGRARLILDDLIYFNAQMQKLNVKSCSRFIFSKTDETLQMIDHLPFRLTDDQRNTILDITEKAKTGTRVNALVQGDVGCGKTIVAFALMRCAAENGFQSILMAPTQILAKQHYEELKKLVPEDEIAFYDGTVKSKVRENYAEKIKSREIRYIIGTSALLYADIDMQNVALSIVDEEHRFGVLQRNGVLPEGVHTITMSATPIPRSLAQTIFGDGTDIYQILQKPAGRLETKTYYDNGDRVDGFILNMLQQGNQVYIVCPLKTEAEEDSLMEGIVSTEEVYAKYKKKLEEKGFPVGCVTGDTKVKDKEEIIGEFKDGKLKVLISTTVIEVGVNVPSANIMVILNADRFGLATLHQLRGRIGRGNAQGICVLVADEINSRIKAMCRTTNGFEIAEEDLKERKSGDLLGLKQSGKNRFVEESLIYPTISTDAKRILEQMSEEDKKRHIEKYRYIYPVEEG